MQLVPLSTGKFENLPLPDVGRDSGTKMLDVQDNCICRDNIRGVVGREYHAPCGVGCCIGISLVSNLCFLMGLGRTPFDPARAPTTPIGRLFAFGVGGSVAPSSNSRFLPLTALREGVAVRGGAALFGTADRGVALVGVVIDAVGGGIDTAGT